MLYHTATRLMASGAEWSDTCKELKVLKDLEAAQGASCIGLEWHGH